MKLNRVASGALLLGCVGLSSVSQAALVGRYTFDEGSGTTANDSSGNGNTGTINGATYTTPAPQGSSALSFSGSNYVQLPTLSPVLGNTFSIVLYEQTSNTNSINTFVSNANSGGSVGGFSFFINDYQTGDGKLIFEGNGGAVISPGGFNDGQVHLIAADVTGANTAAPQVTLYVDGVSVASGTVGSFNPNLNPLRIGIFNDGFGPFNGLMDDVQIYNGLVVPEPASLGLLAVAASGLVLRRRRA